MTTSKILVPAGTNIDGTKDRVPVDIEIPQPLHVVIDEPPEHDMMFWFDNDGVFPESGSVIVNNSNLFGKCELVLGSNVTVIPSAIISANQMFRKVTAPGVETVKASAFAGSRCSEFELPNVKVIEERAFAGSQILKANFPECVELRGEAFSDSMLGEINIPKCEILGTQGGASVFNVNNNATLSEISLPSVKTVYSNGLGLLPAGVNRLELPNIETLKNTAFTGFKAENFYLWLGPNLIDIHQNAFQGIGQSGHHIVIDCAFSQEDHPISITSSTAGTYEVNYNIMQPRHLS